MCDDVIDPLMRTLEYVAQQTVAHNWQGRVSATQCAALAAYDDVRRPSHHLVRQAGLTIFCNSHVALIATDFAPQQPWPRHHPRMANCWMQGYPWPAGKTILTTGSTPLAATIC
ncbi:MAG: hypothetical protein R2911_11130 [Caldilineaceae bacterium]